MKIVRRSRFCRAPKAFFFFVTTHGTDTEVCMGPYALQGFDVALELTGTETSISLRHAGFIVQQLTGFFSLRHAASLLWSLRNAAFIFPQAGTHRCLNVTLRRFLSLRSSPFFFRYAMKDQSRRSFPFVAIRYAKLIPCAPLGRYCYWSYVPIFPLPFFRYACYCRGGDVRTRDGAGSLPSRNMYMVATVTRQCVVRCLCFLYMVECQLACYCDVLAVSAEHASQYVSTLTRHADVMKCRGACSRTWKSS